MKITRPFIKGSAVFTLAAFLFTSSGWAEIPAAGPSVPEEFLLPAEIKIPESLGSVQSFSLPEESRKPLVLYIQDAHAILDAQSNIQKLIAHFQSVYPVRQVLLEGLGGKMDAALLRAFPDAFVREKVMKDYFLRGEMTGAEMAAVFNPETASYQGLEEWKLYEENTRAYLEASANRHSLEKEIAAREKENQKVLDRVFSPEQKELHHALENFHSEAGTFSEWTRVMLRFRKEAEPYPHLKWFLDAAAEENRADSKEDRVQIEKMAEAFRAKQLGRLSTENQKAFQEKFQAFRTHSLEAGAFLQALIEWGSPLGMKPRLTRELEALLKRHETLSSLQGNALFDEIDAFTFVLESKAAKTAEARQLLEKTRELRLLKKLAALELTRKEWAALSGKKPDFFENSLWEPSVRFYQLALKRDDVFHQKLKKAADKEKSGAIIVLAGGFHAQGFETFLKENQYPYASIMPAMASFTGQEKYEFLMRGEVSWNFQSRGSLYDSFMRHTSRKLSAALNTQERLLQIKNWRDEILRMLAKEGRSSEAGSYLKYLENGTASSELSELQKIIEIYKTETLAALRQSFEPQFAVFSEGFEELVQSKNLNVQTVSALMNNPSALSPSLAKFDPAYRGGFSSVNRAEAFAAASLNQMRAESRPAADPVYREEFLVFLEGGLSNDLPTGDITHLGSVGQRVRGTLSYLLDHYQHYHYASESEMWGDLLDILWQRRESFRSHLSETVPANHYIETAVKHALIDRYRKMQRELKEGAAGTDSRDPESVLDEILEDVHDRPDQSAIASESSVYLAKALAHLTPEETQLIHMHFWDQLSYHEIAQTMGLNEGTVRNRILKAMESLKPWLPHQDWVEEEAAPVSEVPEADARALDAAILSLSGIRGGKKHPEKTFRVQRVAALYRDGFDYAEISHQTGLVDGTTRRTIHRIKELLGRKDPKLVATLLKLRSENGGQIQHRGEPDEPVLERNENRYIEVENGQLIRIGDIQHMRLLVTLFQQEEDAYIQDTFTLDEINLTAEPKKRASQHAPDRIFVYDPMGQLLEKRSLGSIFPMHETYDELLSKKTKDLKSPFEKEVGILQDLLRGLIHPFLEEMGLEDRKDEVLLSFEKDYDSEGLPVFHLHFKLLGLGPLLTEEDFLAVPAHDRAAFQHAFEFWYPYFYVRSSIDLAAQEESAARDEKLARKYTAQRLSAYAGALERVGEATHVIYQTHGVLDEMFVAGQVETFLNWAEEDLRLAFPEHAPEYNLILPRLRELMTLRHYSLPLVHILTQKYESTRHETRLLEQPRVTVYGGADDRGPGSSSFLLEIGNSKILIDAGQDVRRRIGRNRPEHLDAILLSHAHGDHAGDLPWVSAMFPETRVYATGATRDTALLMLDDSASFQTPSERGLFRRNIQSLKRRFLALDPKLWYQVTPEVKIRFQPASHILGASLIYIATPYRNYLYTGDFSGDPIRSADKLELLEDFPVDELWEESTYGKAADNSSREEREAAFAQDAARIVQRSGKILVPTFALGRTADVAVTIRYYQELGAIPANAPIYVDGLAGYNLESYMRYVADSEDPEEQNAYKLLEDNVSFVNSELRRDLMTGKIPGPFFILGGSGSLAGGRALQYFPVIAEEPENAVFIVGYQFPETVGRRLKDGERNFTIDGKQMTVRAELLIHDFGAHARQRTLVDFAERTKPRFTYLIHGELGAKETLKGLLEDKGLNVSIPKTGDIQRAAEDADEFLDSRQTYFHGIASMPVSELKKKEPVLPYVRESMTESEQQDVIGGILVAMGRISRDPEGHAMIRELIEKKRSIGAADPFTSTILEFRALIHENMDNATLREKARARQQLWNELQRRTGRPVDVLVPAEKPKQPRLPKRDPALVIAERYQRTLDEFSLSITEALRKREQAETPSAERVREVVGAFLHQTTVQIEEGRTPLTIAITKPDGGLNSGNVARAMQYYLGPANVSKEERWIHAWEGLDRNFGERRENRDRNEGAFINADFFAKQGISSGEFTALMYPGAGDMDGELLALFKNRIFSNLAEYHLNSTSYSPEWGGSAEAGERAKNRLLEALNHPADVSVVLNPGSYFVSDREFHFQTQGKRIFIHKLMGNRDLHGSNPLLYTDALLKGWLRPGDLVFVMIRGRHEKNPFQWSKRLEGDPARIPGMENARRDDYWHVYEVTHQDIENARQIAARLEAREKTENILPLILPSPETLAARQNLNGIAEEAESKIQDAGAIFDRLEDVVSGKISSAAIAMEARETLGPWADWMDVTGFSEEIAEVNLRNSSLTENSFALAKQFLSRPDLVRKYFPEVLSPAESVALESDLLFSLSPDAGEIQPALKSAFRWTGILYPKKSSAEKQILEMVKQDGQHFAAVPYDGNNSVRSRHLGIQGETPLVWLPEGVLNFAGDKTREKEFKALGFQIKSEVLPLLAAQKLTLKEALMLLKLFSLSSRLRGGLLRAEDGFLVLDGEGLKTGIQTLAALWSREAENIRLLSLSA